MDIEAEPVFVRWQVECSKCGKVFYVDNEPEGTIADILAINDVLNCELRPEEQW